MSDTPDLDKAREAANRLMCRELPIPLESLAVLILEQRAEEAERCAKFLRDNEFPGSLTQQERADDLRRQAAGGGK